MALDNGVVFFCLSLCTIYSSWKGRFAELGASPYVANIAWLAGIGILL